MKRLMCFALLLGVLTVAFQSAQDNRSGTGSVVYEDLFKYSPRRITTDKEKNNAIETVCNKMHSVTGKDAHPTEEKMLHDFAGNEFLAVGFGDLGYGILNVANGDVVELAPFSKPPFDWGMENLVYVPWSGFFSKKGAHYYSLFTGEAVSLEAQEKFRNENKQFVFRSIKDASLRNKKGFELCGSSPMNHKEADEGLIYADVEVPYSWYFKRNISEYPYNETGYCGYVAASMLLGYNEIFASAGYFSADEATTYITPYVGSRISDTEWDGVPEISDSFPTDIWGEDIGGAVPGDIHSAVDSFLKGKGKRYDVYDFVWYFSTVTDPIKDGVPAAYFGSMTEPSGGSFFHVVTAYGYYKDSGDLLVHYGWDGYSQVVMSQLGMFARGGVLAVYNKHQHVHGDYFIDEKDHKHYCACGEVLS